MMLPTPSTSHVSFDRIYEPAEDSFLLLDTLSSESEKAYLKNRFSPIIHGAQAKQTSSHSLLVVEIGTGSGVVISFLHAHAETIFGRSDIVTAGVDVNPFACTATRETVRVAEKAQASEHLSHGFYVGNMLGDLTGPLRSAMVDVLVFNPPYVPTPELPTFDVEGELKEKTTFDEDSKLLELSYAGGVDGMESTNRLLEALPRTLSDRGLAYVLFCAQNKPEEVKQKVKDWGNGWAAETVGTSGKKGGWEKLQIVRIWKDNQ